MDFKRVTEWLATAEGLGKAVVAFLGVPALLWAGVTKFIDPLGLPKALTTGAASLVLLVIALLLWKSFRSYAEASRLEHPDAFAIHANSPSSLVGRTDDLDRLVKSVKQSRLVLLDGESGCGKSALISAGLIPELRQPSSGLLPIAIRDWGEDWIRGPLSSALDALFQSITPDEAGKLGWSSSPDLAADTSELARDLEERILAIFSVLGRRPLLIADQFDDYQARHRHLFLDEEKNWMSPAVLARSNEFWSLVCRAVNSRRLHLLVVTRADTAAGLACVRFLGDEQTLSRTLPRVETEYLRPLLANLAADDAKPPIVSNPTRGWHALRECLEDDLKIEGAVLMQQVRTVLLGVRQLSLLTPTYYRRAGGLRGVETLVISRALRRAGETVGGGDAGSRAARAVLARLILAGGPNQSPKAQRASLSLLSEVAGSRTRAETILAVLQREEIVRPAEAPGESDAWQLDHDYLARAAIAEAQQSDRWSLALSEGKQRYETARGWRQRWSALLSTRVLAVVCWERARNRLRFGSSARYARISGARPLAVVLSLAAAACIADVGWHHANVALQSYAITQSFGTQTEVWAVLEVWQTSEEIRKRVFLSVLSDTASSDGAWRFKNALASRWLAAHVGLEPARAKEAADLLQTQLLAVSDSETVARLSYVYGLVASRLSDADAKSSAAFLLAKLETERDPEVASSLGVAYDLVTARPGVEFELRSALAVLRLLLERDDAEFTDSYTVERTYASLAGRLNVADARAEAASLRVAISKEPEHSVLERLTNAYGLVTPRLGDADLHTEVDGFTAELHASESSFDSGGLLTVYATAVVGLKDAAALKTPAALLREHLFTKGQFSILNADVARTYSTVVTHLSASDAMTEAYALRKMFGAPTGSYFESALLVPYSTVAALLDDPLQVRLAAEFLRSCLEKEIKNYADRRAKSGSTPRKRQFDLEFSAEDFVEAYGNVAVRLDVLGAKGEAAILQDRFRQERDVEIAAAFARAYAAVAPMLGDPADQKAARAFLQERLEQASDSEMASVFAQSYARLAARQNNTAELKAAVEFLRSRFEQEAIVRSKSSFKPSRRPLAGGRQAIDEFAQAYVTVAQKLPEADMKVEAAILRSRMLGSEEKFAGYLSLLYAEVASRLNDVSELEAASDLFYWRLRRTPYGQIYDQSIEAYSKVMSTRLLRANPDDRVTLIAELLSIAGNPYIEDRTALLAALRSTAKRDFRNDVASAVAWAKAGYAIDPGQLRPRRLPKNVDNPDDEVPARKTLPAIHTN